VSLSPNTTELAGSDCTEEVRGGDHLVLRPHAPAPRPKRGGPKQQPQITGPWVTGTQLGAAELTGTIHPSGRSNALSSDRMSADERLKEISELLATAILRRHVREGRN
jgi:hypothetical protein